MRSLRSWVSGLALLTLTACGGAAEQATTRAPAPVSTVDPEVTSVPPATNGLDSPTVVNGLVYMTGDERFRGSQELVDVLVPSDPAGPWPVVVVLHGDPGVAGRKSSKPMATELAERGRVVFAPDWGHTTAAWQAEGTLREQWDSLVEELRCAVAFAEATASEYGGNPGRITVVGYSAGGNAALMAAMSDLAPSEYCVASGPGVDPQAVVSIEGDLLIGAPVWDQEFVDDPEAFYSLAPWRLLDADDTFPIHILAAADTAGAERSIAGADPYDTFLADRHTDIDLIAELGKMGILDDDIFSSLEASQWAHRTFSDAGYATSWAALPDSRHAYLGEPRWAMSDQAWELAIDVILRAENPTG